MSQVLTRLQRGIEELYRIATGVDVGDFVVDGAGRAAAIGAGRAPREQLLVAEDDRGLEIGLYVDAGVLAHLEAHDPRHRLDHRNTAAFLYAVEGVSHFVYAVWCAHGERTVSALELELQAEVDKYVTCLLTAGDEHARSEDWRARLYTGFAWEDGLDAEERDRYRAANDNASRYARSLERRFVAPRKIPEMLDELRRFYRLPLAGKLDAIAQAA